MDMNFEVFNTHSMPVIYKLCKVSKIRKIVNSHGVNLFRKNISGSVTEEYKDVVYIGAA
jgi:hypothetical protein